MPGGTRGTVLPRPKALGLENRPPCVLPARQLCPATSSLLCTAGAPALHPITRKKTYFPLPPISDAPQAWSPAQNSPRSESVGDFLLPPAVFAYKP